MAKHRDLVPITIYIPPEAKAELERRAAKDYEPMASLARKILLGKSPPVEPSAKP